LHETWCKNIGTFCSPPPESIDWAKSDESTELPREQSTDSSRVSKLEYVIQDGSMTVYDINALPTAKVVKTKTIPTDSGTRGTVACGDTLWISYGSDNTRNLGRTPHLMAWDLVNDVIKWNRAYNFGIDSMSITRDCSKIYMPEGELSPGGLWAEIDATNGNVLGTINAGGHGPHNTFIPSAGTHVYMGPRQTSSLVEANVPANTIVRTFASMTNHTVRPFTVSDDEKFAFATDTGILGFQVFDVATGNKLFSLTPPGFSCSGGQGASACSHGISLSPDSKEIYVIDAGNSANHVHVYDVSKLPGTAPSLTTTITLIHGWTGSESPCAYDCLKDGWIHHSLDGKYAFVGDSGAVIDTSTRKEVAFLPAMKNTRKEIEIDFSGGHVCATMQNRQSSTNPQVCH